MNLLPAKLMPYAKAWVSLIAAVLVTLGATWDAAPEWLTVAAAVAGAVAVYFTPNKSSKSTATDHDPTLRV